MDPSHQPVETASCSTLGQHCWQTFKFHSSTIFVTTLNEDLNLQFSIAKRFETFHKSRTAYKSPQRALRKVLTLVPGGSGWRRSPESCSAVWTVRGVSRCRARPRGRAARGAGCAGSRASPPGGAGWAAAAAQGEAAGTPAGRRACEATGCCCCCCPRCYCCSDHYNRSGSWMDLKK